MDMGSDEMWFGLDGLGAGITGSWFVVDNRRLHGLDGWSKRGQYGQLDPELASDMPQEAWGMSVVDWLMEAEG